VVCCAASQGLTVLWQVLRKQGGRRVAIEDPGWRWQRYTVEHAGLEAVPVRVDAAGLVVSDLAAADVDAVVMTPAHQYPTGVVMTAQRLAALITWARERRALIVEDDYRRRVPLRPGAGGLPPRPRTGRCSLAPEWMICTQP
jgi:GntR family transcriptional regulator/MocR family aminotransferase